MNKAFVLGAGLGTRLRPITDQLPKPLIPVMHRPLIEHAFDHLQENGVRDFIINTHHLPEKFAEAFPDNTYKNSPLTFRHEDVLLETAGGIANIADLVSGENFIVYNGDILSDLPLEPLFKEHAKGENIVTLVLRTRGPGLHIALDKTGRLIDIRNQLRTGKHGKWQFTGIYAVRPDFFEHLTTGKVESVIPIFLKLITEGARIGSVVVDDGLWFDLGDRFSYLRAHKQLVKKDDGKDKRSGRLVFDAKSLVHPEARVHPSVKLNGSVVIGPRAEVGEGATLQDCILWPDAKVAAGANFNRCIVRSGMTAQGAAVDTDF
jgi:mannose-1-phosphate guanylyltransferase